MEDNKGTFGFNVNKIKKRKLKKGETSYPEYDFKTIEEVFDALTPENMNRFFKCFKLTMSASVYMREMVHTIAKEKAKEDGVEINMKPFEAMKMTGFKWIDD